MNTCLSCDYTLLRHVRHGGLYWYCPHCRQEMPRATASICMSLKATHPGLDEHEVCQIETHAIAPIVD